MTLLKNHYKNQDQTHDSQGFNDFLILPSFGEMSRSRGILTYRRAPDRGAALGIRNVDCPGGIAAGLLRSDSAPGGGENHLFGQLQGRCEGAVRTFLRDSDRGLHDPHHGRGIRQPRSRAIHRLWGVHRLTFDLYDAR